MTLRVNLDKADLIQEVLAVVVEEVGEQPDCLHLLAGVSIRVTCRDASIAASTSTTVVNCFKFVGNCQLMNVNVKVRI